VKAIDTGGDREVRRVRGGASGRAGGVVAIGVGVGVGVGVGPIVDGPDGSAPGAGETAGVLAVAVVTGATVDGTPLEPGVADVGSLDSGVVVDPGAVDAGSAESGVELGVDDVMGSRALVVLERALGEPLVVGASAVAMKAIGAIAATTTDVTERARRTSRVCPLAASSSGMVMAAAPLTSTSVELVRLYR